MVVVGQTRILAPSTSTGAAGGGSNRTAASSSSPSPSKRKFQFQNNRTSPYERQEARHVQHDQSEKQQTAQSHHAGAGSACESTELVTVGSKCSGAEKVPTSNPPTAFRPVELLNRRKVYVEGRRELQVSSSSELSSPVVGAGLTATNATATLDNCSNHRDQAVGQQSNNSRQISPASCNSESVASSNVGSGTCGLCGLMPHCAILESSSSSAKVRNKLRGGNTVIVEEELPPAATSATATLDGGSSRTLQEIGSSGKAEAAVAGTATATTTTTAAVVGSGVNRNASRMSKFNSSSMDRSVDSIGSCSLDVDADSTDFSGTATLPWRLLCVELSQGRAKRKKG